jgi:hypothetical protein
MDNEKGEEMVNGEWKMIGDGGTVAAVAVSDTRC